MLHRRNMLWQIKNFSLHCNLKPNPGLICALNIFQFAISTYLIFYSHTPAATILNLINLTPTPQLLLHLTAMGIIVLSCFRTRSQRRFKRQNANRYHSTASTSTSSDSRASTDTTIIHLAATVEGTQDDRPVIRPGFGEGWRKLNIFCPVQFGFHPCDDVKR